MTLKRMLFVVLALALVISVSPMKLAAQTSTTGAIVGTVTDPSGAVVPNAAVDLKDNVKGATQSTKTSAAGVYQFNLLAPSNYTVTVTATGFQSSSATVEVSLGSPTASNFAMKVSSGGTTVTVTEEAPLVQAENGDTATALSQQQVSQIPNPGNDLSFVAQLAPGVVVNSQGGFGNIESFGLPATSNLFTLNGMDDNDPFLNVNNSGASNLLLGSNEVQEADVVTNGYSGSFGTFAGANVNYVTKSGGNAFHGNAIYYWNGSALNANNFFNNAQGRDANGNPNSAKPFSNANQWAGSIGGPIKKDKLFFFFNTEGLRVLIPVPALVNVPTIAFEQATVANLTALGLTKSIPFYCQNLANICPGVSGVPGSGAGIFNLYNGVKNYANAGNTLANGGCAGGISNPAFGGSNPCALTIRESPIGFAPEKQLAGRADWNIGANDRAFMRMQYDHGMQPSVTDPINPLFNTQSDQPEYQGQLSETHSFGATAVNQFLVAATWYSAIFQNANLPATLAAFPTTLAFLDGSLGTVGGADFAFPQGRNVTQIQFQDDVSKTWGNHTFKFGAKYHKNYVSDHDFGNRAVGLELPVTLDAFFNGGTDPGVLGINPPDKNPDFSILQKDFASSQNVPVRLYEVAGYMQDEWRIKPNFTVTGSLRAEHASNPVCLTLCFAQLSAPFGSITQNPNQPYNQAINANQRNALLGYPAIQWEPRVSFAWQPFTSATGWLKSNFVVRGGVGIFYDAFPGIVADSIAQNSPFFNGFTPQSNFDPTGANNLPLNLSPNETSNLFASAAAYNTGFLNAFNTGGGFCNPGVTPNCPSNSTPFAPNTTFTEPQTKAPQFQKWSLEVQKGFGANTSLSVGYYGNHGIHIPITNNSLNAFGLPITSLPAAAPAANFSTVAEIQSDGVSNYNGMTASFQHRFTKWAQGLVQVNYTYSHAFDDVSNGGFLPFTNNPSGGSAVSILSPENPANLHDNYGPADYDVRHNLNANYVLELPVKTMLRGHGSDFLTRGWQVSGALFTRTGLPYTVIDGTFTGVNNYQGTIFPQITGNIASANCGSTANAGPNAVPCLSPNNFVGIGGQETAFGTGLRNLFRGPHYFDTDFTVTKNTKIPGWERGTLGIGFQFFNLFNHPNFNLPVNNVNAGNFATLQSTVNPPTSILGSFLGGDASPRLIQLKASLTF